jgi:hypothetical protein
MRIDTGCPAAEIRSTVTKRTEGEKKMKTPWTDENAWAEEDHGDFWVPQERFPKRVKGHLWFVALAAASVVWIAIRAAGAA